MGSLNFSLYTYTYRISRRVTRLYTLGRHTSLWPTSKLITAYHHFYRSHVRELYSKLIGSPAHYVASRVLTSPLNFPARARSIYSSKKKEEETFAKNRVRCIPISPFNFIILYLPPRRGILMIAASRPKSARSLQKAYKRVITCTRARGEVITLKLAVKLHYARVYIYTVVAYIRPSRLFPSARAHSGCCCYCYVALFFYQPYSSPCNSRVSRRPFSKGEKKRERKWDIDDTRIRHGS